MSKSKLTIQIASLNVYIGSTQAANSNGIDALLEQIFTSAATVGEANCDETACGSTESETVAPAVPSNTAALLRNAKVMTTEQVRNSSTGLALTDTRKQGAAVDVNNVNRDEYVVVQAASAEGEALKALGLIETVGYVNKYYKSGNFGSTIHATINKADSYSDGDCVAVEVYVAYALSLQEA